MAIKLPEDTELENGKPVIRFENEVNCIVAWLTLTGMFILSVNLGLGIDAISSSPIVIFTGWVAGFFVLIGSYLCGFILFLISGKIAWMSSFLTIMKDPGFRAGIGLLCAIGFVARVLSGVFQKLSYIKKTKLSLILLGNIAANMIWFFSLIKADKTKYLFMYATAFTLYMIVAYPRTGNREKSEKGILSLGGISNGTFDILIIAGGSLLIFGLVWMVKFLMENK